MNYYDKIVVMLNKTNNSSLNSLMTTFQLKESYYYNTICALSWHLIPLISLSPSFSNKYKKFTLTVVRRCTSTKITMFSAFLSTNRRNLCIIGAIILIIIITIMLRRWAAYLENKDQEGKSCYGKSESDDHKEDGKSSSKSCVISSCSNVVKTFTFEELKEATRDFRIRIGVGATSFVYLAQLEDGRFAAVKRVMEDRGGSKKMFLDEVSILLRISHPNLVGMMGFCLEQGEQLLLLEYVPNKSLFDRMHTQQGQCRGILSWSNRVSIALDIARALDYLHTVADPPVIHRDIKSSNILLVNNNHAKLADFGLCKLGHDIQTAPLTPTTIKGSLGYVDTNYLNTGLLSPKSDVYSFGVILLELVTGLKSIQGSTTIAEWTEDCRKNQNVDVLVGLLDPKLKDNADLEQLKVLIDLANLALLENAEARPDMKFIVNALVSCTEDNLQPQLPV